MTAAQRWRDALASWQIPEPIRRQAADSPWVLPRQVFTRRTEQRLRHPHSPSLARTKEALRSPGSLLDVGAGGGAGSLPLADHLTQLTAVDGDRELLDSLAERAAALAVRASTVLGMWPQVADETEPADVVVCHHVFYNVPELGPFALALTAHARRRVVAEMTAVHPLTVLNPLWEHFHAVRRPLGPTADDAIAVLNEAGIRPHVERWTRPAETEYADFAEMVEVTRRRLCLPPGRAGEVAEMLRCHGIDPYFPEDLGSSGRDLVTLWWEP